MSLHVNTHLDTLYWKNRPVRYSDFAEIREYVDACLKPDTIKVSGNYKLSSDFNLLIKLIKILAVTIPWPTAEQLEGALSQLPPPPTKPLKPFKPTILGKKPPHSSLKKTNLAIEHLQNHKHKEAELKELLKIQSICEKYIAQVSQWEKDHEVWQTTDKKYFKQLISLQRKVDYHRQLFAKIPHSIAQKKILLRIVQELTKALDNGGLTFQSVSWNLLPEGPSLSHSVNHYLLTAKKRFPNKAYDNSRIEKVIGLKPNKAYIGNNEFDGYIVFLFNNSPYAVLECPWLGNALYLLEKKNWPSLSKLPKSTLLHSKSQHARRIIHDADGKWFKSLKTSLGV